MLVEFILEQIEQQPPSKAVLLYRALAADAGDCILAKRCHEQADHIERVQRAHQQLLLEFKRKAT